MNKAPKKYSIGRISLKPSIIAFSPSVPHAISAAISGISVIKQFANLEYVFQSFFDAAVMVP